MRGQTKRQLTELLDTMREALGLLDAAVQAGELSQAAELLAGQQEAAVAVGNEIEASEGEGTEPVRLLESYCEALWQAYQEIAAGAVSGWAREPQRLLEQAIQALQELPRQLEIVFLPYKASMWDCMESVWRAACEDGDCHATVLPIPYFDIQDGQVKERHYEGDSFPPYVPVADYRQVQLEELQPDAIFVHNPFDRSNKVTSVLPQFYSEKLREVTKRLIYIPYFVVNGGVSVTHRYLPSYDNMDFIVTQCESMAASFASGIPKEKFLPFGSPIADRIIRVEREKPPIPEEWKSMLPNGRDFGGCRTVMLNTSISMLMQERDRFLNKIEYVLELAGKTQGILLIWRPHPLLHTAAASMGEQYVRRLEQLERRFLEKKTGVLDKTPDVGVTVALSDAYLGEAASSVIAMFGIAGKPCFYINMQLPRAAGEQQEEYSVTGCCGSGDREYLLLDEPGWVLERTNGGEPLPLFKIPARECIRGRAYANVELRDGRLWLYPENAQGTLVYEPASGRMWKDFEHTKPEAAAEGVQEDASEAVAAGVQEGASEAVAEGVPEDASEAVAEGVQEGASEAAAEGVPETGATSRAGRLRVERDSLCGRMIRAERFQRGNVWREWYEDERQCPEDYFSFLLTADEKERAGNTGRYSQWLANMDGSCGARVLQAVKKSLGTLEG